MCFEYFLSHLCFLRLSLEDEVQQNGKNKTIDSKICLLTNNKMFFPKKRKKKGKCYVKNILQL